MSYEEAYSYAIDMATMFINEEDAIAKNMGEKSTVFTNDHPLYSLLAFVYPNLFLADNRKEYDKIINNEIRSQQLIRIRIICLSIIALTGIEFINKLTSNIITGICMNSGDYKSRALRKELETYFKARPSMWFCVLASSVFNNRFVANSKAVKTKKLDTVPMTRKAGVIL